MSLLVALALMLSAGCYSGKALLCSYVAREGPGTLTPDAQEFQPRGACATRPRLHAISIRPEHLQALDFSRGLGVVLVSGDWYYVRPDGESARVLPYDNEPDPFQEGLARTVRNGKVGFIDRRLSIAIRPTWDFAFPFEEGCAVVCNDCQSRQLAGSDYSEVSGGLWGYINRSGEVVIPVSFEQEELPRPHSSTEACSPTGACC